MLSYGSTIEAQDVKLLETLGFEVENPNQEKHQIDCQQYALEHGSNKVMEYFTNIVRTCDVVAFRSLPTGQLLSGISAELQAAMDANILIIELPCSVKTRMMEYPETKQYLIELGHYKV